MQPEDRKPLDYLALSVLSGLAIAVVQMRYPTLAPVILNWMLGGCGVSLFACIIWLLYEHLGKDKRRWWREKRITPLIAMIVCGLGFLGFAAAYFGTTKSDPEAFAEASKVISPVKKESLFDFLKIDEVKNPDGTSTLSKTQTEIQR